MKLTKNKITKIILLILCILIFNFITPYYSYGGVVSVVPGLGGILNKPIVNLLMLPIDALNSLLNTIFMPEDIWNNVQSVFNAEDVTELPAEVFNTLMSPDKIFKGEVSLLNANIFEAEDIEGSFSSNISSGKSLASSLKRVVANVYVLLRNIAAIVLLCLLIYTGIRILLQTAHPYEQAKWKQSLLDWVKALCLLLFMHYLMVGVFYVSDLLVDSLAGAFGNTSIVASIRLSFQNTNMFTNAGTIYWIYLIMYAYVTYLTIVFIIAYFKRFVWVIICIIISPIVAVTEALGSKARIFDKWFKEYIMAVLIQPFHMLVFYILVAIPLGINGTNTTEWDPLGSWSYTTMIEQVYILLSISMIRPAEKFLMGLFGFGGAAIAKQASSESGVQTLKVVADGAKQVVQLAVTAGAAIATGGASLAAGGAAAAGATAGATGGTAAATAGATAGAESAGATALGSTEGAGSLGIGMEAGNVGQSSIMGDMLDVYNEGFGTSDWDPQVADAMSRTAYNGIEPQNTGTDWAEVANMYRESGLSDEEITNMFKEDGLSDEEINKALGKGDTKTLNEAEAKAEAKAEADNASQENSDDATALKEAATELKEAAHELKGEETGAENAKLQLKDGTEIDVSDEEFEQAMGMKDNESNSLADKLIDRLPVKDKTKNYLKSADLQERANNLWANANQFRDTMYLDGAPGEWSNGSSIYNNAKEKIDENKKAKMEAFVNNKNNIDYMVQNHGLLKGIENCKTQKEIDDKKEKAENKAKEMLKEAEPYVNKGITDMATIDKLIAKENKGMTPTEAMRSYVKTEITSRNESKIDSVARLISERTGRDANSSSVKAEARQTMQQAKPYIDAGRTNPELLDRFVRLENTLKNARVAAPSRTPEKVMAMDKVIENALKKGMKDIKVTTPNSSLGMQQLEKIMNKELKGRQVEKTIRETRTVQQKESKRLGLDNENTTRTTNRNS